MKYVGICTLFFVMLSIAYTVGVGHGAHHDRPRLSEIKKEWSTYPCKSEEEWALIFRKFRGIEMYQYACIDGVSDFISSNGYKEMP